MNYSVIIPHKNVPKLLARCVNSIPVRDDIEVIVIDDCSSPEFKVAIEEICNRRNTILDNIKNKSTTIQKDSWE